VLGEGASMRIFSATCAGRGGVDEKFLVDVCWERRVDENLLVDVRWGRGRR
jgi:hypothetical protein